MSATAEAELAWAQLRLKAVAHELALCQEMIRLQRQLIRQLEADLSAAYVLPYTGKRCDRCRRPVHQQGDRFCSRNCMFLAKVTRETS